MSADKAFVDTNVFVYLYSENAGDTDKRFRAYSVFEKYDCQISTQVLNEFSHVCVKKLKIPNSDIQSLISQICSYCDLSYINEETIKQALSIHGRYGYSYYDSLMASSALETGCKYLLSEDMADGQVIDGVLTIKNIFAEKQIVST
jgi:predicted nucleic acid-binding protein